MKILRLLLAAVFVLGGMSSLAAEPTADPSADILRRNGVEASPAALLAYLKRVAGAREAGGQVAQLIAQLGDDDYEKREAAVVELKAFGPLVREPLKQASRSPDAEVASRAKKLLESLGDEPVLYAALEQIEKKKVPGATAAVLDVLPFCPDSLHREKAQEVVWALAADSDAAALKAKLNDADEGARVAAVVGLEASLGADAVPLVKPLLKGDNDRVRLAAVRAVVNHLPRECAPVLVELSKSPDDMVRLRSHFLLRELTGEKVDFIAVAGRAAPGPWELWLGRNGKTAEFRPVSADARRRQRGADIGFCQTFVPEQMIEQGYGDLSYFDEAQGKAFTKSGRLHLGGTQVDGDQRLTVSSLAAVGTRTFPTEFQVRCRLGGQAVQAGAWHVGLSVGNVRFLFHPGFEQGAFRAERVDAKAALSPNENMGFTPAGDELYPMTVKVVRGKDEVRFAIAVLDPKGKVKLFEKELAVRSEDAGELSRLGLERSGRVGGDALFDSLLIEPSR